MPRLPRGEVLFALLSHGASISRFRLPDDLLAARAELDGIWARERSIAGSWSPTTVFQTVRHADLLLMVGRRASDTVQHGSAFYREALKYYLAPLTQIKNWYFCMFPYIEERVLLLLMALGGDSRELSDWLLKSGSVAGQDFYSSPRDFDWDDWNFGEEPANLQALLNFGFVGYGKPALAFQGMLLLGLTKLLAAYRPELERLETCKEVVQSRVQSSGYEVSVDDIIAHVSPYLVEGTNDEGLALEVVPERIDQLSTAVREKLPEAIRDVISAIRYHGNEECLLRVSNVKNGQLSFSKGHVPKLFDEVVDNPAPRELWDIYRDCFHESSGVMDILREFLEQEERATLLS